MTIPISNVISSSGSVITTASSSLASNMLVLTQNALCPSGNTAFSNAAAVSAFFGEASSEAAIASLYFAGFKNSTTIPSAIRFAPYNTAATAGFLRGAATGITLAQLQALSGTLTITMNGTALTSATINLASATSFSNAATLIAAAFTSGPAVTYNATLGVFIFTSTTTGAASTMSYATGTLSTSLGLTSTAGATLSAGGAISTPSSAMTAAVAASTAFVTYMTMFEPVTADKQAFAVWNGQQSAKYLYLAWDTDQNAFVAGNTTCFGALCTANDYEGCLPIGCTTAAANAAGSTTADMAMNTAAFIGAVFASTNPNETNGRVDLAYVRSSSLSATCTDDTSFKNSQANGYTIYGAFANGSTTNSFLFAGALPGSDWAFADSYVDQIRIRNDFQSALLAFRLGRKSVGYDTTDYTAIRAALLDPINTALNFGSIRAGVTLSDSEIQAVAAAVGKDVSSTIENTGWYLSVTDPTAAVRVARGTPVIKFFYTDGQSVHYFSAPVTAIM